MKHLITFFLFLFFVVAGVAAKTYSVDEIPNVHLADSSRFVSNPDDILSPAEVAELDNIMRHIRRSTTAEAVVVVVDDIEGGDIDGFATDLFTKWGLGKKDVDNGLLILVAKDLRRAAIRPGYGLEGVMPDIVCGRILRKDMFPAFKRGDYGAGLVAASQSIDKILSDPQAAAEIRSGERDADFGTADSEGMGSFFGTWFLWGAIITVVLSVVLLLLLAKNKNKSPHEKYMALAGLKPIYLAMTFVGLALPALASIPLIIMLNRWRNSPRKCPRCGTRMNKVDEVHDNDYLTPVQDTEEQLGSVDYDVWLCPGCGETDIEPYVQRNSGIQQCPRCHGLTMVHTRDRIERQAGVGREGRGVHEYTCRNCHYVNLVPYVIPMIAVLPVGGRGRGGSGFGGFGGGGSFGGGFGGGMTGGGGASGGW